MSKAKKEEQEAPAKIVNEFSYPSAPKIGDVVYYYKDVQDANGKKLKCFAAIVLNPADGAGNFQPQDVAIDLHAFTCVGGGGNETKKGVIFSPTPKANRWSLKN